MKKYLNIFLNSVLAGFAIVIGATVYLSIMSIDKILGSLIFALGLYAIIHFKFWLYTGKVGSTLDNKPSYLLDLLVCVIGNFVGVISLAFLIKSTRVGESLSEAALKLVEVKQADSPLSIFFLSFMCGIMIYLAVKGHEKSEYPLAKTLFVFLSVSIFILCGFEHCIANGVYYVYAGIFDWYSLLLFVLMIVGNGIGSIFIDGLIKLTTKK